MQTKTVIQMRIDNLYISDQPKLSTQSSSMSSVHQAGNQQRTQQDRDSYNKNAASAQVIDAEHVDLYSPDSKTLQQEHQDIYSTLEPEMVSPTQEPKTNQNINSIVNKYQTKPVDVPHPGTYLNIFA